MTTGQFLHHHNRELRARRRTRPTVSRRNDTGRCRVRLLLSLQASHDFRLAGESACCPFRTTRGHEVATAFPCPQGHEQGARLPPVRLRTRGAHRHGCAAAGPRNQSGDHTRDKTVQSTTVISVDCSSVGGQTLCKPSPPNARWRSLHTREVAGSSPAVPIKIPANVQFWLSHKISRASRERSLVRAHPCPYWKALVTPGLFVSTRGCWGHRQGLILACGTPGKVCGSSTCSTCGASVRHTRVERGRAHRASRTSVGRWILCGAE